MKKVIFALANSEEHAQRIVDRLQQAGFDNEDISFLMSDKEGKMELREDRRGDLEVFENKTSGKNKKGTLGHEKHSKAPEGSVTGGVAGGVIGGSLGLLAGIGSLAIPGLGMFIAAGPIVAALSGSAVGGAVGLLVGSLIGLGIPEYEAKKYESKLKKGHLLICVHTNDSNHLDRAKEILQNEGATDIGTSKEKAGSSR
jgi:hypothetical protein